MKRGYTIILAITILMLLGSFAALVCAGTNMRAQNLSRDLCTAQARQLVLAGLDQCPRLLASGRQDLQINIPAAAVPSNPLVVFISRQTADRAVLTIHAQSGPVAMTHTATFAREGNTWHLLSLGD